MWLPIAGGPAGSRHSRPQVPLRSPEQTSVAEALRAIRHAMENWHQVARGDEKLTFELEAATKDESVRDAGDPCAEAIHRSRRLGAKQEDQRTYL